jgi:hypothetical protein
MNKAETKEEFAKRFAEAVMPSEENNFKGHFTKELWPPDHCASLVAGLDPETYRNGKSLELPPKEFAKRTAHATAVLNRFLDDVDKDIWQKRDFKTTENEIYASVWKYIKWIAEQNIIMHKLFFNQLSMTLMELYFQFQPTDSALINAPKHTREYHEAYYLLNARELIKESGRQLPSTEIYNHPRMQSVQHYIRDHRGKYKKRTFLLWLSKLRKLPRGRPKKV